jgi:hypothetical protein
MAARARPERTGPAVLGALRLSGIVWRPMASMMRLPGRSVMGSRFRGRLSARDARTGGRQRDDAARSPGAPTPHQRIDCVRDSAPSWECRGGFSHRAPSPDGSARFGSVRVRSGRGAATSSSSKGTLPRRSRADAGAPKPVSCRPWATRSCGRRVARVGLVGEGPGRLYCWAFPCRTRDPTQRGGFHTLETMRSHACVTTRSFC